MPQRSKTPETGVEDLKEGRKASPRRRDTPVDKSDATTDEDMCIGVSSFSSNTWKGLAIHLMLTSFLLIHLHCAKHKSIKTVKTQPVSCVLHHPPPFIICFALQPQKRSIKESTIEEMPKKPQRSDQEKDETYGITGFVCVCVRACSSFFVFINHKISSEFCHEKCH